MSGVNVSLRDEHIIAMRITKAIIKNFNGIVDLELPLDPQLNILVGDNGSGKTAILEALTVGVGTLFAGMKDVTSAGFKKSAVRYTQLQEYAYPVMVAMEATLDGGTVKWERYKNSQSGTTTTKEAYQLIDHAKRLDHLLRSEVEVDLPMISYFATSRLFVEVGKTRKKAANGKSKKLGSRYRGSKYSLDARSNFRQFLSWFELKELSHLQKRSPDVSLEQVRKAIVNNLPGCRHIFYDFDPDTNRGLTVELEDERVLPFDYLSDGMRSFIAMIADIAHRCVLLNPHYGGDVLERTEGVVLIDELDLHLHPSWQKAVINGLRTTFPGIQFIISTHSPFLIQEAAQGQLIILDGCQVERITGADELSLEDIAEFKQGVPNPQWSTKKKVLNEAAAVYLEELGKDGEASEAAKNALNEKIAPFTTNPAYEAVLEMERLKRVAK